MTLDKRHDLTQGAVRDNMTRILDQHLAHLRKLLLRKKIGVQRRWQRLIQTAVCQEHRRRDPARRPLRRIKRAQRRPQLYALVRSQRCKRRGVIAKNARQRRSGIRPPFNARASGVSAPSAIIPPSECPTRKCARPG